ncbi:MOT2 transcription factor [Trachipleistophora hominis]|uniref:MOT2 transcription factor n=1 Tax=Trachipleistophora hominis TaxID=72359 RepID=L7JT32_TRAHO|nr:MOT2 transcription factor [Trachipleistophora hominis]
MLKDNQPVKPPKPEYKPHEYTDIRVIQRNLVYIIGIPVKYADENVLKSNEFFGQFGNIKKLVIKNRSMTDQSVSAYITYEKESSAVRCITEVDESLLEGRALKCTFGTTKYCSFFLKNLICQNCECMYLHEIGEKDCALTKEEMCMGKHKLHSFRVVNKGRERIGKKKYELNETLFKYKEVKNFRVPEKINFCPK